MSAAGGADYLPLYLGEFTFRHNSIAKTEPFAHHSRNGEGETNRPVKSQR